MEKRFVGINYISEYLGVKVNTIYSWVSQRKIPYTKANRLLRFDIRKIEEWVKNNSIEARI